MTTDPPRLLTVPQVAERLALSRAKTYALVMSGQIPSLKIDHARRVHPADLARFVDELRTAQE